MEKISKPSLSLYKEPKEKPVAWVYNGILHEFDPSEFATSEVTPLYTKPPKRKWVGLTDEEITELCELVKTNNLSWGSFARKLEVRLKEKNTNRALDEPESKEYEEGFKAGLEAAKNAIVEVEKRA